jgi:hypothetical protein
MFTNIAEPQFSKHSHFDLMLPSNEVLNKCVGARVKERGVCHEWPLSCVEKVIFDGEIEKYCKTMRPPSIEIEVYSSITSPLLVPYLVVAKSASYDILLLDSFSGQRLSHDAVEKVGFSAFVDNLKCNLSTISGARPVYIDLSTVDNVRTNMATMLERLQKRFAIGALTDIDPSLLNLANNCANSREVCEAFIQDVVYSNGDLSADNILVLGNEMKIIDWQFPRLTSINVELVNLYTSLGIDPRIVLPDPVIAAGLLCKIRWFAECADTWLPNGGYQIEITKLLEQIRNLKLMT